jgi:hypothetical protein
MLASLPEVVYTRTFREDSGSIPENFAEAVKAYGFNTASSTLP